MAWCDWKPDARLSMGASMNTARARILADLSKPSTWLRADDGTWITERGPSYWSADGLVSRTTCTRELADVAALLRLERITTGDAVSAGVRRRPGRAACFWRSHATEPWREAAWFSPSSSVPASPTTSTGWTFASAVRHSGPWSVRCPSPEHSDRSPSAIANPARPGHEYGLVWCLRCGRHTGLCKVDGDGLHVIAHESVTWKKSKLSDPNGAPGPWRVEPNTKPVHLRVMLGARYAHRAPTRHRDLGKLLVATQRRLDVGAAWDSARQGAFTWNGEDHPPVADTLVTLEPHTWDNASSKATPSGGRILLPEEPRPACATWILVDIDNIDKSPFTNTWADALGSALRAFTGAHKDLTDRVCVIRTSGTGLQLVCQLREARWKPREWARGRLAEVHDAIGTYALWQMSKVGFRGGQLDRAAIATGRCVRLPGPRVSKDGTPWVAELMYAS